MLNIERRTAKTKTEHDMLDYAELLARQHIPPNFCLSIRINRRLTRSMGRFLYWPTLEGIGTVEIAARVTLSDTHTWLDTVRHELAHALDFAIRGTTDHGPAWRSCCYITGCSGEVEGVLPDAAHRYQFVCPECGNRMLAFDRLTGKMRTVACYGRCRKCDGRVQLIDRKMMKEAA